ncbi:Alpha/Beta hydrolase protein [Mariannaea sp. PMI_226]|nr:Alpha/Beta hydrolase protein [Mariannaea sp. PMI_226]
MSSSMIENVQHTHLLVENEGAIIRTWSRGNGPLLILIPGGGGTGECFNKAMPGLSRYYTVVAYDRRGNGQSTVEKPRVLNPLESARDIVAIVKAMGRTKAFLFGTSSGGIFALQVAQSYPQYVDGVVLHEVPIVSILPEEHIKRVDSGYDVFQTYLEKGAEAALRAFRASVSGTPVEPAPADRPTDPNAPPHRLEYFFKYEFIIFMTYTPNMSAVKANGVPVVTVEGIGSKGVFHAVSAKIQSDILGCRHVVWSGAHAPFIEDAEIFGDDLHKTILMLQT